MAKNIVLLSDGTGNSSSKLMKTNVWRVYESLQLTDPKVQVACYDDGVGTSSFKPLALAGGAVGVGLRRNVLRLYRFLCEHYDPGDRIFLFGFSRGAFTIRVLAGMICDQGVIRTRPTLAVAEATGSIPAGVAQTRRAAAEEAAVDARAVFDGVVFGSELARLTKWAYRDFRRLFDQTGGLVKGARKLRDWSFRLPEWASGAKRYDKSKNHQVDAIEFVGVWDTVDAYGLPIDELTDGIDRWVWPLSMPTLTLSKKVQRACHVLALDDERNTFHPVLWDESDPEMARRISQVWFAGMHSNVGGGYPDDALSYVSLNWMTEQAAARNLLFVPNLLQHHTAKADPFGRIYDSREGLKGYYRYNPRRIEWLTNGQTHEFGMASPTVNVALPKIHESVFKRIAAAPEAYAPIVFPPQYAVVMEKTGKIVNGDDNPYETREAAARRVAAQEACWDLVWLRRIVYFATVGATLFFLIQPLRVPVQKPIEFGAVATALEFLRSFLPDLASRWISYYQVHTRAFVLQLGVILLLMSIGQRLQARICHTMRGIWLKVVPPAREEWKTLSDARGGLSTMRNSRAYQAVFAFLRRKLLPNFFGIFILAWMIGAANRLPFEAMNASGAWCKGGGAVAPAPDVPTLTPLSAGEFCRATGIQLEAGQKYRIELAGVGNPSWRDDDIHVPTPAGFTWLSSGVKPWRRIVFAGAVPFRRVWSADWFVPIARVGRTGLQQYALNQTSIEIAPRRSGELFLFLNDAIAPTWRWSYRNNTGTAQVTVTRVSDP